MTLRPFTCNTTHNQTSCYVIITEIQKSMITSAIFVKLILRKVNHDSSVPRVIAGFTKNISKNWFSFHVDDFSLGRNFPVAVSFIFYLILGYKSSSIVWIIWNLSDIQYLNFMSFCHRNATKSAFRL